ncbi:hypothetical protein DICSQDRAFT_91869 [Dichomitus squalens LYAD-421 SS1]|uniref:Uncharacterized protein n=1 Tax=Dichomitus squalens (strain LYAD-421) TaxID=732165 RepID=R7SNB9_DICSQ|nr:uncharacterized protein DICSQDRAFT_91869 [Dichomitus squalens LYAD-421 SS1]EJF57611.1 hypothetical protein DICSQDRAFT_91869 [Dichomitus squalens LYAD-421 SS1]
MFAFSKFVLLATAVAGLQMVGTSAQSISSQCQATLAGIVSSSDASCLNAQNLVGLVLSSGSNASIVPTLNTWLTGLCAKPACSNDTLSTIVQNVTSGCQSDLNSLGLSGIDASQLSALVQTAYPTVRSALCLADSKQNNQLCVIEYLDSVQPYTGNLTLANIEAIGSNLADSSSAPSIPANVTCTDCVKGVYSVLNSGLGSFLPSTIGSSLQSTCGASFTDGSTPSDVAQLASGASSASSSTTVTPNGAVPALSFAPIVGVAASVLVAAVSALFVLA